MPEVPVQVRKVKKYSTRVRTSDIFDIFKTTWQTKTSQSTKSKDMHGVCYHAEEVVQREKEGILPLTTEVNCELDRFLRVLHEG